MLESAWKQTKINLGFAALLMTASPAFADGVPEHKCTPAEGDRSAYAIDGQDVDHAEILCQLEALSGQMETLQGKAANGKDVSPQLTVIGNELTKITEALGKDRSLPPEVRAQLKNIDSWIKQSKKDATYFGVSVPDQLDATLKILDSILKSLGTLAIFGTFLALWQARKYRDENEKTFEKQKEEAAKDRERQAKLIENLGDLAEKNNDFFETTGREAYENQHNVRRANAVNQHNSTMELLSKNHVRDRSERLGALSDVLPYISRRIQSAKKQVILSMPFHLFGLMGNPRAWNRFHETLREEFESATGDDKELIVLIYGEKDRKELARKRYSRAVDALRMLAYPWQNEDLLKTFKDNKPVEKNLREAIEKFNEKLTHTQRKRISKLCFIQRGKETIKIGDENYKSIYDANYNKERIDRIHENHVSRGGECSWHETGDALFLQTLDSEDKKLFQRAKHMRRALGDALAAQEMKYFNFNKKDIQTIWEKTTTVIEAAYDEKLDDKMAICIDGQEVIKISSDMANLQNSKNTVESELGPANLQDYKETLENDLREADIDENGCKEIIKRLDEVSGMPRPGIG